MRRVGCEKGHREGSQRLEASCLEPSENYLGVAAKQSGDTVIIRNRVVLAFAGSIRVEPREYPVPFCILQKGTFFCAKAQSRAFLYSGRQNRYVLI